MKQIRFAIAIFALSFIGATSFAAGRLTQLPLDKETKTAHGTSCVYVTTLDLGDVSSMGPVQVFTLFQGRYHLLANQPALTPEKNGRLSMRLSSYKEVAADANCPDTAELLVVK